MKNKTPVTYQLAQQELSKELIPELVNAINVYNWPKVINLAIDLKNKAREAYGLEIEK